MKNVIAAAVIGLALIVAAGMSGGRYRTVGGQGGVIYVVDRFTGSVRYCRMDECRESRLPLDFSARSDLSR